jgi:hypothetical protein
MKKMISLITFIFALSAGQVFAAELDQAKAAGWVGEQANGYLGLVKPNAPEEIVALVKSVNSKRRAKYKEIAAKRQIPLQQVEKIAGQKAFEKTKPGHFIKTADGRWRKK